MQDFIGDPNFTAVYDEQLARDLISKIIVYDDRIQIQFKAGLEAEVEI